MRLLRALPHRTMETILRWPLLFWACVGANMLGALLGGLLWYGPQLRAAPVWAYPFIPDCPLAALLGAIALFGLRAGRRWQWFYALAAFACIKYGLWTLAFWLREWTASGVWYPLEVLLFVSHIGLCIEGVLLLAYSVPLSLPTRLAVIGWFLLSIVVDYGLGYHPPLTPFVSAPFVGSWAVALTVVTATVLLLLPNPAPVDAAGMPASTERYAAEH